MKKNETFRLYRQTKYVMRETALTTKYWAEIVGNVSEKPGCCFLHEFIKFGSFAHTISMEVMPVAKASVYFDLDDINGKHGVSEIKKQLDAIPGVFSVSVNQKSGCIGVDYDTSGTDEDKIRERLAKDGFHILNQHTEKHIM